MGIRCWGGEGLQCRMTKPITHLVALRSTTVLCQWLRSASSTSPFRCARPQVVQKVLDHRLTEWSLLIILDKFKQGYFSTDHSPPMTLAFSLPFPHVFNRPHQLEFTNKKHWDLDAAWMPVRTRSHGARHGVLHMP